MTTTARRAPRTAGLLLRVLAAVALGVSAYLHVVLAQGPLTSGPTITVAGLFLAQAVVAGLVAVWVLVRGSRTAWAAALVVALASLAALVLSVYVQVPAIGPFPALYEPAWYPEKVVAAVSVALAAAVALLALARGRR